MKTALDFSTIWGIGVHEITRLCQAGRIPGARQEIIRGRTTWMIPDDAQKPVPGKSGPKPKAKEPTE